VLSSNIFSYSAILILSRYELSVPKTWPSERSQDPVKKIRAAIIQFDVRLGDVKRNYSVVARRITSLAKQGAHLIVLPEMWSTGFANDRLNDLSESTPKVLEDLSALSRELGVTVIGSLPEKARNRIYNTAYVTDSDGSIAGAYRKVHLFTLTGEERYFQAGREAVVSETSLGPIGLMICYDLRFPELCRSLALRGARIVAVMAQWPAERVAHWKVLLLARAIENQLFVLGANRCGKDEGLAYAGHSRIVSPYGEVIARAGRPAGIITGTIDLALVEKARKQIPCLKERVPEAYE
jgi:omega-amidase